MARRKPPIPRDVRKTEQDIAAMRRAGRVVALALQKVGEVIRPGVSTRELDSVAEQTIRGLGALPAFLGYRDYPATACISLNDEVVHGIPTDRLLKDGDIVSVDLGAVVDGWYGDSAYTYSVGEVSDANRRLMDAGQGALAAGVAAAKPGNRIRDIGAAVQQYAEERGYSVVRDLCGHGIGRRLHEEPQVPNYPAPGGNIMIVPGMALAIEPMLNAGGPDVDLMPDGWTFVTADGTISVHYEHTVLIQPDGPEILTVLR